MLIYKKIQNANFYVDAHFRQFHCYIQGKSLELLEEAEAEPQTAISQLLKEEKIPREWVDSTDALVDPWGTPYKLHIRHGALCLHSAGPDGVFQVEPWWSSGEDSSRYNARKAAEETDDIVDQL